jgi:hypothetical protein
MRLPFLGRAVEQLLDQPQLALAADKGRLQPHGLQLAAHAGHNPERAEERDRLGLALDFVQAGVLVGDCPLGRPARRLAHQHRSRLRDRLHARSRVHQISGDHPLTLGSDRDGRLTREHSRTRAKLLRTHLLTERRHRLDQIEPSPNRTLRIVLGRRRRPPNRHHRIPNELLHRAAVPLDHHPRLLKVPRKQVTNLLRVTRLRHRRETDQVGEQHRDETALGGRSLTSLGGRSHEGHSPRQEPHAALAAEVHVWRIRTPTCRTGRGKRVAALAAKLLSFRVLCAAAWAERHIRAEPTAHGFAVDENPAFIPANFHLTQL